MGWTVTLRKRRKDVLRETIQEETPDGSDKGNLKSKQGEGYIDVAVLVLCVMLVALSVKILPVFICKQQLDTFATELCREASYAGSGQ